MGAIRMPFVALCALLSPCLAVAATLTNIDQAVSGDPTAVAIQLVRDNQRVFGAVRGDQRATLAYERTITLRDAQVVRVSQRYDGQRVLDAGVSVLIIGGRVVAAAGTLRPINSVSQTSATLSAAQLPSLLRRVNPTTVVRSSALALAVSGSVARQVFVVDAQTSQPFELWRLRVDAATGAVLQGVSTRSHATRGRVYLPNPVVGVAGVRELQGLVSDTALEGEHAKVSACRIAGGMQLDCDQLAKPDADGQYLYQPDEPSATDPFAEVHAYYHVDAFHRWLADQFDFARSVPINVFVNLHYRGKDGQVYGFPNAFFGDMDGDGKGDIVFGQGQRDFAYDADVIYHEFTHSVVADTANLRSTFDQYGFNDMPGALNEGFADLLSAAFSGDGVIGEYAGGLNGGGAIRDLTGPLMRCPDDLKGESHQDSQIWTRALWSARTDTMNKEVFDKIVYQTMAALPSEASMRDAAAVLQKTADANDPVIAERLRKQLLRSGLNDCSRFVPLDDQHARSGIVFGTQEIYGAAQVPAALQYKIRVPNNATELRLTALYSGDGPGTLQLHVRRDQPVGVDEALKVTSDLTHESAAEPLVLHAELGDDGAENPLVPGATYYVLPVNTGQSGGEFQLLLAFTRVEVAEEAPVEEEAPPVVAPPIEIPPPVQVETEPTSGCSVSGSAPTPWMFVVCIGIAALVRRRRPVSIGRPR